MRFETDSIIGSIEKRIADSDTITIYDIYTVIIPVRFTINIYIIYNDLPTLVVGLIPTCRIVHPYSFNSYISTFSKINIVGTVYFIRPIHMQWVIYQSSLNVWISDCWLL